MYVLIKSYLSDRHQRVIKTNNKLHSHTSSGWGKINHEVLQGSTHALLHVCVCACARTCVCVCVCVYINDLQKLINYKSKPILFGDDTGILISNHKPINFQKDINISEQIYIWVINNLLSLDLDKTHYLKSWC
jgi:hypothetical protein